MAERETSSNMYAKKREREITCLMEMTEQRVGIACAKVLRQGCLCVQVEARSQCDWRKDGEMGQREQGPDHDMGT